LAQSNPVCFLNFIIIRKQQLQMEVLRALEKEDNWWRQGDSPSNVVATTSPKHFKSLILGTSPETIVVSYFFSPTCNACRTLYPKLLQIAKNNKEVLFVKCNTAETKIASLADGLKVNKIPWFVIFSGGPEAGQLASFTANLATVDSLRAEISGAKECTAPECATN
jgi:thioredoxin-like negative regulator of GroEL